MILKSMGSLAKTISLISRGGASSPFWLVALAIDEIWNAVYKGFVLWDLWASTPWLTPAALLDIAICSCGIDLPVFNLLASMAFPGFLDNKRYEVFYPFTLAVATFVLPPAHALMLWLISGPMYM